MVLVGAGAFDARRRRGDCVARRQGRARSRRGQGRLERLLRAAQRGLARRRARSRLCAGAGRAHRAADGGVRHARCCVPARRRRDRRRARRLRRSISAPTATAARCAPMWCCRARPIRKNPAIYVNTEGRVQMATRASFPPGDAREDWAILRALSDVLGHRLPYDLLAALRQALFKAHPHLHARSARSRRRRRRCCKSSRRSAAPPTRRRSRSERRRFLLHQSDRALFGGDGGMFGDRAGARDHDGGGVAHDAWPHSGPITSGRWSSWWRRACCSSSSC